jgi:hypothetical protein
VDAHGADFVRIVRSGKLPLKSRGQIHAFYFDHVHSEQKRRAWTTRLRRLKAQQRRRGPGGSGGSRPRCSDCGGARRPTAACCLRGCGSTLCDECYLTRSDWIAGRGRILWLCDECDLFKQWALQDVKGARTFRPKKEAERQWQAELDEKVCRACLVPGNDERLLLCDGCDAGYHMDCLRPPMAEVPEGDWLCPRCVGAEGAACKFCGSSEHEHRMLLCDRCSSGCHLGCHDPPLLFVPPGPWYCDACDPEGVGRPTAPLPALPAPAGAEAASELGPPPPATPRGGAPAHKGGERAKHDQNSTGRRRKASRRAAEAERDAEAARADQRERSRKRRRRDRAPREGAGGGGAAPAGAAARAGPQSREGPKPKKPRADGAKAGGHSEPGRTEPGRAEPGRAEPGRAEPGRAEPGARAGKPGEAHSASVSSGLGIDVAAGYRPLAGPSLSLDSAFTSKTTRGDRPKWCPLCDRSAAKPFGHGGRHRGEVGAVERRRVAWVKKHMASQRKAGRPAAAEKAARGGGGAKAGGGRSSHAPPGGGSTSRAPRRGGGGRRDRRRSGKRARDASGGARPGRCEMCGAAHDGAHGSGRFCSVRCSHRFSGGSAERRKRQRREEAEVRAAGADAARCPAVPDGVKGTRRRLLASAGGGGAGCENCGAPHAGTYGSGRFCSKSCSRSFSARSPPRKSPSRVRRSPVQRKSPARRGATGSARRKSRPAGDTVGLAALVSAAALQ